MSIPLGAKEKDVAFHLMRLLTLNIN